MVLPLLTQARTSKSSKSSQVKHKSRLPPGHAKLHSKAMVQGRILKNVPSKTRCHHWGAQTLWMISSGIFTSFSQITEINKHCGMGKGYMCLTQRPLQEDKKSSPLVSVLGFSTDQRGRLLFQLISLRSEKRRCYPSWKVLLLLISIRTSTSELDFAPFCSLWVALHPASSSGETSRFQLLK